MAGWWHHRILQDGGITEYFLLDAVCQSRLDGSNGSLACTVIATLLIQQVINSDMALPMPGESPNKACLHQFISAMHEGNAMYDSRAMEFGLLSIYDVLDLWPNLHLGTCSRVRPGVSQL